MLLAVKGKAHSNRRTKQLNKCFQNPSIYLLGAERYKYADSAVPSISDPYDCIIRINFVGVCGSDVRLPSPLSSTHHKPL